MTVANPRDPELEAFAKANGASYNCPECGAGLYKTTHTVIANGRPAEVVKLSCSRPWEEEAECEFETRGLFTSDAVVQP